MVVVLEEGLVVAETEVVLGGGKAEVADSVVLVEMVATAQRAVTEAKGEVAVVLVVVGRAEGGLEVGMVAQVVDWAGGGTGACRRSRADGSECVRSKLARLRCTLRLPLLHINLPMGAMQRLALPIRRCRYPLRRQARLERIPDI